MILIRVYNLLCIVYSMYSFYKNYIIGQIPEYLFWLLSKILNQFRRGGSVIIHWGCKKCSLSRKVLPKHPSGVRVNFYVFILISSLFFFFFFFTWGTQAQICACFLDPYFIFLFYITLESIDSHKKRRI